MLDRLATGDGNYARAKRADAAAAVLAGFAARR
jgi:hypothetical protein